MRSDILRGQNVENIGQQKTDFRNIVERSLPFIILFVIVVLFFNRIALSNLILARGDTFLYFYPYWNRAAEALQSGRIPLWNPDIFMGAPFLANSQVGFFYPLNWPLWWLLPTPYAVSASILIHILIAGIGTYLAGRQCLSLSAFSALIASLLFAVGGYVTAQVEHINQLQGIAWLPWFLVALCTWKPVIGDWKKSAKLAVTLAILFSFQLLAGHMQTAFITLVGVAVWLILTVMMTAWRDGKGNGGRLGRIQSTLQHLLYAFIPLILGGLMALMLSAIQLLPTLELTLQSSRQGGLPLNEALSFSLHPLLLTRSLLPAYDQELFSEYVAMLPLAALILATIGAWHWRKRSGVLPLLVLAILGLFFAMGLFNPIYLLLARWPGFNWFRAPARWMVLYALGVALLAGMGMECLIQIWRTPEDVLKLRSIYRSSMLGIVLLLGLMVWGFLALQLSRFIPVGAETSIEAPSMITLLAWLAELLAVLLVLLLAGKVPRLTTLRPIIFAIITIGVLFAASRILPYNNPTTPEAVFDLRPPIARLLSMTNCSSNGDECQAPGGRFLSLSDIFFDVGDQAEIDSVYQDQLPEKARYEYTIATKQKEVLSPNLSMLFDLPAVDGFDGGVLPLRSYNELTSLVVPDATNTTDGRLREHLDAVPADRWLDLFNARYIITDKVGDEWVEGVFFDQQFAIRLTAADPPITVGYIPNYESTELWLVAKRRPGLIEVRTDDNNLWQLEPNAISQNLYHVTWPEPATLQSIKLYPCPDNAVDAKSCNWEMQGLALVDSRDGTFQTLVPGDYRLIHSGDVKIYENLDVLSRAYMVYDWFSRPTVGSNLEAMSAPSFDPSQEAVILDSDRQQREGEGDSQATIVEYESERVVIQVDGKTEALLILTDAIYPGWQATIDGQPAPIVQTDVLFRGVVVPPGSHEVEFVFQPSTLWIGLAVTVAGLLIVMSVIGLLFLHPRFWPNRKSS